MRNNKIDPIILVFMGIMFFIIGFFAIWYGNNEKQSYYTQLRQLGETTVLLGFFIIILAIIFIVIGLVFKLHQASKTENKDEDAKSILDKRYAKGEIIKEEYEQMKKNLEG